MKLRSIAVNALVLVCVLIAVATGCTMSTSSAEDKKPAKPPLPTEISCETAPQFEKIAMENFSNSQSDNKYVDVRAYYADIANMATNMARLGYEKCDNPK